jgi:two-component system, chemotaxis family, protein-glutamate methylesterase/glutaminase
MKPIRVLIVEDSAVVREHLRRIISADERFEVVGMAATGEEAVGVVEQLAPDVITMDIQLPGIQGLDATRQIMSLRPTPIVIVSGVEGAEANLSMQALRAGALAVIEKPVAATHAGFETIAARLRTQLAIMSEVKVVKRREFGSSAGRPAIEAPCNSSTTAYRILALAASTGGPNALLQVLNGLGPSFALPVAIVQHMTPAFVPGFAEWLGNVTARPVTLVSDPVELSPGAVYVAAPGFHLAVKQPVAFGDPRPPLGGHRPSGNVLFASVARAFGPAAIGVILTGMGDDGAAGLAEMRRQGAFTIAEDQSSAVVYGMPAAAAKLRAVCESHPLDEIAGRIHDLVTSRAEIAK